MTYGEAVQKLEQAGQTQLLKYYEQLSEEERDALLEQIEKTDFSVAEACKTREAEKKGKITPLAAMQLAEIGKRREEFTRLGIGAIKAGKAGAVLLAGGMGTRLGSPDPKGMYNIGVTKTLYIFECLIRNLLDVVERADAWVRLFIMTSEKNKEQTEAFFKEHGYFGYNEDYVTFFVQEMAPASDYEGKVYLEEKGRISTSPNGNGGWFISMKNCGALDIVKREGIEWLNVFAVDNVLQRIADPCFIGAVLASGCESGAKVVKKSAPDEKVGVMCLEDGHPSIVEYYELTEEMRETLDEKGEPAYNFGVILNYLFHVKELWQTAASSLPLHVVEKKIKCLDEQGNQIEPDSPNGYKYETLVLDMIHQMPGCLPYEVEREKEFAPVKNKEGVDSVDTARELLMKNGVRL